MPGNPLPHDTTLGLEKSPVSTQTTGLSAKRTQTPQEPSHVPCPSTHRALYLEPRGSIPRPGSNSWYSGMRSAPTGAQAGGGGHRGGLCLWENRAFMRGPSSFLASLRPPSGKSWGLCAHRVPRAGLPPALASVFAPVPVQVCGDGRGARGAWPRAQEVGIQDAGNWPRSPVCTEH